MLALQALLTLASTLSDADPLFSVVFRAGDGGFPCIRVPSLIRVPKTSMLLAFAECRSFAGDGCTPQTTTGAVLSDELVILTD